MKKDEDIKVNRRRGDKIHFESPLIQSIADKIDFIRGESKVILEEIDSSELKRKLDGFDLEEFSEDAVNQIDDLYDEFSRFKDDVVSEHYIPEEVKKHYRTTQRYLDRDGDYVRRAQRKLERLDSNNFSECHDTYLRVIELCDKAIEVREDNFDAYLLKAKTLVIMERYEKAIEEYIKALSIKDDIDVWLAIAKANRLNGDLEDAISVYDKVISMDKNSFEAFKGKAFTYFDLNEYPKANFFFKKADSLGTLDEASKKIWSVCKDELI